MSQDTDLLRIQSYKKIFNWKGFFRKILLLELQGMIGD